MGNQKSTVKTRSSDIEIDSINEEIDVSSSTECDLYNIVQSGKVACFEKFRKILPNIANTIDRNGNNLFHLAAYLNRYKMISHLSQYANINQANNCGDTPLHIAASHGYKECIESLLGNGANVNVKNKYGTTPLHSVTMLGRNDCVEVLLGYGADVNAHECKNGNAVTTTLEPDDFIVLKDNNSRLSFGNGFSQTTASSNANPTIGVELENENDDYNYDRELFAIPPENVCLQSAPNGDHIAASSSIPCQLAFEGQSYERGDPQMMRCKGFRRTVKLIQCGRQMQVSKEKMNEPEGHSPLQYAINSNNLAIFNLMIDHASTLKIIDDTSFKLIEKAMSMNVPGVLRCLIGNPSKDGELTVDYLEQRLNSCISKEGKNISADYHSLISSTFRSIETLVLIFLGISGDNNFESLLQHTTVRTFIQWRWKQTAIYFYINLSFFSLVYLNIIFYKSQFYYKTKDFDANGYISYNLLFFNLIALIIKEAFQFGFNWRSYLLKCENYFGISLIIYSIVLLVWYPSEIATRIQVSAIGNILIAVSVTLQIGQHPWAAPAVHLLKVVAYRFLRHFIVYIGILIGFAYSFHELHKIEMLDSNLEVASSNSTSADTDNLNWLEFAGFTILRTAGMFIGELNLGEFNVGKANYVLITILFLFILFVSIMMLNLLNGLAVSNIFEKTELEISQIKMRIQYLYGLNSKINLFNTIVKKLPNAFQKISSKVIPTSCGNMEKLNILILPTYLSCKDLKIREEQQHIHNNKIHKNAYEILQRNKIRLNL